MATMHATWNNRRLPNGNFTCPAGCGKDLKAKISGSDKNPGRVFVGCNKDFGGCGIFGWLDEEWVAKPQFGQKRGREGAAGTNLVGPIAGAPGATDTRLAEVATKLDTLVTSVEGLARQVAELQAKVTK